MSETNPTAEPIIEFAEATVSHRFNLVLTQVNFRIERGDFVYLVGKTGTGKSTLLKTLYADVDLYSGGCSICGYDLTKIKRKEIPFLRRKLGIVFQDFQLLSDRSINNNLAFVLRSTGWTDKIKIQDRIDDVLIKVGLSTKGNKMPHELSGGEQQRVCIARSLLNDPELILADEPTGNLDPDTSEEIMKLLFDINASGTSVLMCTHDYLMISKYPARTLRCLDGTVVEANAN
ncbi:MAG: ATP-binding cassette domain-containing protein [Bacteroidota bacterium]|jgi:cell division transport system ATP-binding protein